MNENLLAFQTICSFVSSLSDQLGHQNHHLRLYAHLLQKTQKFHTKSIEKHVQEFKKFVVSNRKFINNK